MISIITDIAFVIALACPHQRGSRCVRCSAWTNSFSLLTWAAIGFSSLHRLGAACAGAGGAKASTAIASSQFLNQRAAGVSPSCGNCRCHNVCTAGSPCPQCRNLPPVGPTRQWRRGETLYFPASRSAKSATVLA
jgi:hypothetical protein